MPLAILGNVPFSEMRGQSAHQGPRTAGNKSLLTFRSDIGIPGYTGYTPGSCTVPIPVNGSNQHTGRLPDDVYMQEATIRTDQHHAASEYNASYQADPSAYHAPNRTGGGYWFEDRQRKAADNSPAFMGITTYRAEVLNRQTTAMQQLEQSQGLNASLVTYKTARDRRGQSAQPKRHQDSTTGCTSTGEVIGYQTTYNTATALVAEKAATLKTVGAARPMTCSGRDRLRMVVMPSAGKPLFEATSSYAKDYGMLGSDPMLRATTQPAEQTSTATTKDLSAGTTRACHHPPGYTGFIPAATLNESAAQQAAGTSSRENVKAAMLPSTLDQYSRGRLAHYTGYKPHGGLGATAVQPAHGPTQETTQGLANLQVLKCGPQPVDGHHAINSRKGIMNFFTGGGESISDNGEADAQQFYARLRPMEGRMKTYTSTATNPSGAKFSS